MSRIQAVLGSLVALSLCVSCSGSSKTGSPIATTATNVTSVQVRAYNTDNIGDIYLNDMLVAEAPMFQADTGLVDITSELVSGANTLKLTETNTDGDYTYGFDVIVNGTSFFSVLCGNDSWPKGYVGCNNNDPTLGVVYDQTLTLVTP